MEHDSGHMQELMRPAIRRIVQPISSVIGVNPGVLGRDPQILEWGDVGSRGVSIKYYYIL